MVPFRNLGDITGREEVIHKIKSALSRPDIHNRVALFGLGGVG